MIINNFSLLLPSQAGRNKDKALTSKPLPGEIFIPQEEEEEDD